MKLRIGITQRVAVTEYGERRDCLDQSWIRLLEAIDIVPVLIPNVIGEPESFFIQSDIHGFILSGGNDLADLPDAQNTAPERDTLEKTLLTYAQTESLPVMGVCRGMQLINTFLGGSLVKVSAHVRTRHELTAIDQKALCAEKIEVNSFHHYGMRESDLANGLCAAAIAQEDANVEALLSSDRRILGIMWHPERETPILNSDAEMIQQHFRISK